MRRNTQRRSLFEEQSISGSYARSFTRGEQKHIISIECLSSRKVAFSFVALLCIVCSGFVFHDRINTAPLEPEKEEEIEPINRLEQESLTESNNAEEKIALYDFTINEIEEANKNAEDMKRWDEIVSSHCNKFGSVEELLPFIETSFKMKNSLASMSTATIGVKRCRNTFIDFGSNIGDSVGKFIDASLLFCMKRNGRRDEIARFDVTDRKFVAGQPNRITRTFDSLVKENGLSTADYCIYGVEGNPHFTERLQALEESVMMLTPRPVKNVHLLTETVGTDKDGPTELFLDTVNEKDNFWGSSILVSHQDVVKSVNEKNDGKVISAPVDGITLSTLMKRTLVAFSPEAREGDKVGGHLILKVDIEGGEYNLMWEAAESGVLCEFYRMGNKVNVVVEYHRMSITDAKVRREMFAKRDRAKAKLQKCGITINEMSASWK